MIKGSIIYLNKGENTFNGVWGKPHEASCPLQDGELEKGHPREVCERGAHSHALVQYCADRGEFIQVNLEFKIQVLILASSC